MQQTLILGLYLIVAEPCLATAAALRPLGFVVEDREWGIETSQPRRPW